MKLKQLHQQGRLGLKVLDESHEFIMMRSYRCEKRPFRANFMYELQSCQDRLGTTRTLPRGNKINSQKDRLGRESFDELRNLFDNYAPGMQTLCLSGTSTPQQAKELSDMMGLDIGKTKYFNVDPTWETFRKFDFEVKKATNYHSVNSIAKDIKRVQGKYNLQQLPCSIVFVATKQAAHQTALELCQKLKAPPGTIQAYHGAGRSDSESSDYTMSAETRKEIQLRWKRGETRIVVRKLVFLTVEISRKPIILPRQAQDTVSLLLNIAAFAGCYTIFIRRWNSQPRVPVDHSSAPSPDAHPLRAAGPAGWARREGSDLHSLLLTD